MRKFTLFALTALLAASSALAVPAKRTPITITQPDGSQVTVTMQGDEFNHSLFTADGKMVYRADDGAVYYQSAGKRSTILAHEAGARTATEEQYLTANADGMNLPARARALKLPRRANDFTQVPQTGSPRIPIILVNYSDIKFKNSNPVAQFEEHFNTGDKSCLKYFTDQSRGKFTPVFDILGPVDLTKKRSTYGGNDSYGQDKGLGTMVVEAVKALQDEVDFTRYDNDGDGEVDVVVILYAGVGEAQGGTSNSVWPCQWSLDDAYQYDYSTSGAFNAGQNGKQAKVDKFAVFNELSGSSDSGTTKDGIGTFCHEFSHCLGLPDFYDTRSTYWPNYGMDAWSLMDYGCYNDDGNTPIGYSGYEREFMGWIDMVNPQPGKTYTLDAINLESGEAVKVVNDNNPDEYYVLENRQKTGWDLYMSASGLMITHVDYSQTVWDNNEVNNTASRQRMTIIPADGTLSSTSNSGDLWPYNGKNALTDTSSPAAKVYTGGYMSKPITEITRTGTQVSFIYMQGQGSGHDDPVLNPTDEAKVTDTAFEASWTPVDDVESYTLQVNLKPGDVEAQLVLEETFNTETFSGEGTRDLGSMLDNYMENEGWTGSTLYMSKGGLRLGSSKNLGKLVSPDLDIDNAAHEQMTVKFDVKSYNNDTDVPLQVTVGGTTQKLTINGESTQTLVFDVPAKANVTFATTTLKKRVIITGIEIYDGDITEAEAPARVAAEEGDENTRTITGITDDHYTVTGLTAGATYRYKVKALYTDGTQSAWSASELVTLLTDAPEPTPTITASTQALELETTVGETVAAEITVTGTDLEYEIMTQLDDETGMFSIDVTSISVDEAAEGAKIVVTYAPTEEGEHTATLHLYSRGAQDVDILITGKATGPNTIVAGDVNADGVVNATDLSIIVDIIAGLDDAAYYDGRADLNGDETINATDIAEVVKIIAALNNEEPTDPQDPDENQETEEENNEQGQD